MIGVVVIVALLLIAVVAVTRDSKKSSDSTAGGEVILEPASDSGSDPFTDSVAAPTPASTAPLGEPVTLRTGSSATAPALGVSATTRPGSPAGLTSYAGGTPGLYGGTRDSTSCNVRQMIGYLADNPAKAKAWAAAQEISDADAPMFLLSLTPVILRGDTRVTNYGYKNGVATPHQSVLQAGTAVLVDQYGEPQAKCACGNPLNPPTPIATKPTYVGNPWPNFTPATVVVVVKNITVINIITLINIVNGTAFGRPTGPTPGPDLPVPPAGQTTTTTTGPTAPPTTGTTTTAGGTGAFTLVDVQQTVGELVANWTVNARAGNARLSIPAGDANYSWTVPERIDPAGTRIEWGGSSLPGANLNIRIAPKGEGIVFDTTDLDVDVTGAEGQKSAVITVPTAIREVKLIYGMGFSVTAYYTYRR